MALIEIEPIIKVALIKQERALIELEMALIGLEMALIALKSGTDRTGNDRR